MIQRVDCSFLGIQRNCRFRITAGGEIRFPKAYIISTTLHHMVVGKRLYKNLNVEVEGKQLKHHLNQVHSGWISRLYLERHAPPLFALIL